MERFIVVLLFFSVTSCQSFINEDIIFEDAAELEEVQEIVVIENEIKPELIWDHLENNATSKNEQIKFVLTGPVINALRHVVLSAQINKNRSSTSQKTALKSMLQVGSIWEGTLPHWGRVWVAKMEPSWHQIAPQIDLKIDHKKDQKPSWDRFWLILGPKLAPKRRPQKSMFEVFAALGAILGPSWGQDGPRPLEDSSVDRFWSFF